MNGKFDVVVIGGGTSGVACAYSAANLGLKTLLVEKSDVLGGAITQGLVIPVMKVNNKNINSDFYKKLVDTASTFNAQVTYGDNNDGWFNPELLKIVFDKLLTSVNCNILFNTSPISCEYSTDLDKFNIKLEHNLLSLHIETDYIVDATANGKIFEILNYDFQEKNNFSQASSLRFIMSGVDTKAFSSWLLDFDKDRSVTTCTRVDDDILLSTAYTWNKSRNWALAPIFEDAVSNNDLEYNDTAYFQLFSVPKTLDSIAFNAPRILLDDNEDILNPYVYSKALIQGRERILRLSKFCKKYLKGFENSYISHISDTLGIRESYRIKGKYTFTVDDIINPKSFENIAFSCDYPIDIHSNKKENDKLNYVKQNYDIPIECLISSKNDKLYAVGRIISADFEAQAALRTQMSCFSMGEAAAKDIFKKLKN